MDKQEQDWIGFSLLEMSAMDGDDLIKVSFMGRWLVDCVNEPTVTHPELNRYTVAFSPTNSYFVFSEPLDMPALRRYEVYDCYEWMENSREVPEGILKAILAAQHPVSAEDREPTDA